MGYVWCYEGYYDQGAILSLIGSDEMRCLIVRIKNLAINYVRNRKLGGRIIERKHGVVYVAAVHRPVVR